MTIRRADDNAYTLLSNGTATGAAVSIKGGEYIFTAEGTVNGATVALQIQSVNGTWMTVQVFNASAVQTTVLPYAQTAVDLPAGYARVSITGGPPSAVYAYLIGLG
jgi:hypothetical protein